MADKQPYDELYKVVLVGDPSVGKTNLLAYFIADAKERESESDGASKTFSDLRKPTIGVEFGTQTIRHPNGKVIKVQIWDTAGQERYRAITTSHYRRAAGALLVYDISCRASFENAKTHWYKELHDAAESNNTLLSCVALVGNKTDLSESREYNSTVSKDEQDELAKELGVLSCRTSAKSGDKVVEAFEQLAIRIYDQDPLKGTRNVRQLLTSSISCTNNSSSSATSCC